MNMISEQAEKLREIADYLLLGLSDRFDFTDVGHKIQEAADTMEALSAKLSINNGWIPCSERLPKKSGEYIVMISGAELPTCLNFLSSDNSWFDTEKDYEVSYWQPLPEAYHG